MFDKISDIFSGALAAEMVQKFSKDPASVLPDLIKEAEAKIYAFENTTVRIALAGPSGRGKSSLINAIAGDPDLAPVGETETTSERKMYPTKQGLLLEDMPGCGTAAWPSQTYAEKVELKECDAIVLVMGERVTEDDIMLFTVVQENKIPCFIVRTKIDNAIQAASRRGISEAEVIGTITQDIRNRLSLTDHKEVYMISNWDPQKFDLADLVEDISEALSGIKKSKFIATSAAYTKAALKKKRPVIEEIASYYAWASAAGGLIPIPGVSFMADIGILTKLSHQILSFYGLTESHLKSIHGQSTLMGAVQGAGKFAAQYATQAGITQLLKTLAGVATAETIKLIGGWLPLIGQAGSALIGYKMTNYFASNLIDGAEIQAGKILDAVAEDQLG